MQIYHSEQTPIFECYPLNQSNAHGSFGRFSLVVNPVCTTPTLLCEQTLPAVERCDVLHIPRNKTIPVTSIRYTLSEVDCSRCRWLRHFVCTPACGRISFCVLSLFTTSYVLLPRRANHGWTPYLRSASPFTLELEAKNNCILLERIPRSRLSMNASQI